MRPVRYIHVHAVCNLAKFCQIFCSIIFVHVCVMCMILMCVSKCVRIVCVCVCKHVYAYMSMCVCLCMFSYVCVHMCVCVHACPSVCALTYYKRQTVARCRGGVMSSDSPLPPHHTLSVPPPAHERGNYTYYASDSV
jgi:hypothetical protein